jgi:hypothetical protein
VSRSRKTDQPTIREAIRAKVSERGLTPSALARELPDGAVSRGMLDKYLRGDNDLSGRRLDVLLRALGLRIEG